MYIYIYIYTLPRTTPRWPMASPRGRERRAPRAKAIGKGQMGQHQRGHCEFRVV